MPGQAVLITVSQRRGRDRPPQDQQTSGQARSGRALTLGARAWRRIRAHRLWSRRVVTGEPGGGAPVRRLARSARQAAAGRRRRPHASDSFPGRADAGACGSSRPRGCREARPSGGGSARAGAFGGDARVGRGDSGDRRPAGVVPPGRGRVRAGDARGGRDTRPGDARPGSRSAASRRGCSIVRRAPFSWRGGRPPGSGLRERSSSASTDRRRQEAALRACRELEPRFGAELRVLMIADRRPAHALVEAAAEADLLAVGSRTHVGSAWAACRNTSPTRPAARCSSSERAVSRPTHSSPLLSALDSAAGALVL
jgi:hypothetical protein